MSHIFYSPKSNLLIESIPKCGLNTVASSIIYLEGHNIMTLDNEFMRPTKEYQDEYEKLFYKYKLLPSNLKGIKKVLVVRNPYTRGLSAFSNKNHRVLKGTKKGEYLPYQSFIDYLNLLSKAEHMNDHHFSPITNQIGNIEDYERVFSIEKIHDFYDYLAEESKEFEVIKKIKQANQNLNKSNSQRYEDYLTKEVINFYQKFYEKDFDILGYSKKIEDKNKPAWFKR